MKRVTNLNSQRFIGDTRAMIVHDRWHEDCEDCLMEEVIASGAAVEFEPDTLEQSLNEEFDCCEVCFGSKDPAPPAWAVTGRESE